MKIETWGPPPDPLLEWHAIQGGGSPSLEWHAIQGRGVVKKLERLWCQKISRKIEIVIMVKMKVVMKRKGAPFHLAGATSPGGRLKCL